MNIKRWTVCILFGHKWLKVYPGDEDQGTFVRCRVCSHENHNVGSRSGIL